jgi:hypothetical protein
MEVFLTYQAFTLTKAPVFPFRFIPQIRLVAMIASLPTYCGSALAQQRTSLYTNHEQQRGFCHVANTDPLNERTG